MQQYFSRIADFVKDPAVSSVLKGIAVLVFGILLSRFFAAVLGRIVRRKGTEQQAMVLRRAVFFILSAIVVITALRRFGFDLGVLLGAAGILTVAVGFASQTSASNLISGLFLIGERPFVMGDVIKVGDTVGTVISIDSLSVRLRTFDNLLVRVPNESLLKSQITNMSHFPIRRVDITMVVPFNEDLNRVREHLMEVADRSSLCLDEPKPLLIILGFEESGVNLQFSVWVVKEKYLELKNAVYREIRRSFAEAGIELAYPRRSVQMVAGAEPVPLRLVTETAGRVESPVLGSDGS